VQIYGLTIPSRWTKWPAGNKMFAQWCVDV
jgi:hypothetical protein